MIKTSETGSPNQVGSLIIRDLGVREFSSVWQEMKTFTDTRGPDSTDELWLLQHPAVFTLGQAGKAEHILDSGNVPVVKTDRGGQVTYHGPGQLVGYLLFDIKRMKLGVRELVDRIELSVISLLAAYGVASTARREAPGVYVGDAKIAALGLRIRKGCSYHGLSLNVDMDLSPYQGINPCGYKGLAVTDARHCGITAPLEEIAQALAQHLVMQFRYDAIHKMDADTSRC